MLKVVLLGALLMGAAKCAKSEEIGFTASEDTLVMFHQYCSAEYPGSTKIEVALRDMCFIYLHRLYKDGLLKVL